MSADLDQETAPSPRASDASWPRRLRRLRWPALVLGLVLIGASLTYLLAPPTSGNGETVQLDPSAFDNPTRSIQSMPSLVGLDRQVARSVLVDAGMGDASVAIDERPAAGPVGLVLEQQPAAGVSPSSAPVRLTVASPAPIPQVVGSQADAARDALERLGAVVRAVPEIRPEVPRGQVIAVDPAEGSPAPTVVTLTVADPGDALTLATVDTVDRSNCSTGDRISVNGAVVGPSVTCSSGRSVAYAEYALARNAVALEATVGTDDREGTGGADVVVLGDGRELARTGVGLGVSQPLRVDLRDVMRLRIEVRTADTGNAPDVVLGDARLLGSTSGLDAIASAR